jgi:GTP-binding protein HflX
LLVVDASDPDFREQLYVTKRTLAQIGAGDVPQRILLNKIDRLSLARREAIALELPDATLLSAHDVQDIAQLHATLLEHFERVLVPAGFVVPYACASLLSEMHEQACIVEERFTRRGAIVRLRARPETVRRWRKLVPHAAAKRAAQQA